MKGFHWPARSTGVLNNVDTTSTRAELILDRLSALLDELWDERPAGRVIDTDAPLSALGVDSLTLVLLLDRLAHEFGVDWEQAAAVGVGGSLRSLADLIASPGTGLGT